LIVTEPDTPEPDDALNRGGEDPAAESGAGYGSHAPDLEEQTPAAQGDGEQSA
jgi:hypothetical protein